MYRMACFTAILRSGGAAGRPGETYNQTIHLDRAKQYLQEHFLERVIMEQLERELFLNFGNGSLFLTLLCTYFLKKLSTHSMPFLSSTSP